MELAQEAKVLKPVAAWGAVVKQPLVQRQLQKKALRRNNMPRPRLQRKVEFYPKASFFKPQGIPLRNLEIVSLSTEEMEAIRLRYAYGKSQTESALQMNTSQSTFQRILTKACEKIADGLVNGKAIKIVE